MLNKEKYAKEILDIVCQYGAPPAVVDDVPIECRSVPDCHNCKFYGNNNCSEAFATWANSEYKEREIDWNKVPVDTPIYVGNSGSTTYKRHFAGYTNDKIIAFSDGETSWSNDGCKAEWSHARIKEGIDCSQWYKD